MILKHVNGVSFFQFPKLAGLADIRHAIFTRHSGDSKGSFRSLNVSYGVGDDRRNVGKNRGIISRCIGEEELVFINQVHGTCVLIFAKENKDGIPVAADHWPQDSLGKIQHRQDGGDEPDSGRRLRGDAMVTDIQNKFLAMQVADCQSVLMYDPVRQVIANVHSGWRGSINNIIGRTVKVMEQHFDCCSRDIIAGISPSLGPCCAQFINYQKEIPAAYWTYKDARDHFDFWSVSCDQLCDAGVLAENLDLSRMCTRCDTDIFFSFRGEGTTGRFAAVIGLAG
ncbi:MAG: polyphenol oxidase family protein [Proteobacteria bacterium]|nr:polyphenol oxidase family protein [Pseudomonadota bacterium]